MAIRATQVWIQVPARPLPGSVMLGKSCNSLSLSFPSVQGRVLIKVSGPLEVMQEAPSPHHLATFSLQPLLARSSPMPCTYSSLPWCLALPHPLDKASPFCVVGTFSGKPSQTPEGRSVLAPGPCCGSVRVSEDLGCVLSPVPSTGSAQSRSRGNIT